jgi:hypothetical protein
VFGCEQQIGHLRVCRIVRHRQHIVQGGSSDGVPAADPCTWDFPWRRELASARRAHREPASGRARRAVLRRCRHRARPRRVCCGRGGGGSGGPLKHLHRPLACRWRRRAFPVSGVGGRLPAGSPCPRARVPAPGRAERALYYGARPAHQGRQWSAMVLPQSGLLLWPREHPSVRGGLRWTHPVLHPAIPAGARRGRSSPAWDRPALRPAPTRLTAASPVRGTVVVGTAQRSTNVPRHPGSAVGAGHGEFEPPRRGK